MHRFLLALLLLAAPAAAQTWVAQSADTLPSGDTRWHQMALDGSRLFIARGDDGLLAWDIETRQAHTVEDSKGANGIVPVPEFGRAYAPMADGTVLSFDLATLKRIDRVDLGVGDLATGFFEPTQKRVQLVTGDRPERSTIVSLDAATGAVLQRTEFNSRAMDTPASNGEGLIFAPMRDRGLLQSLDAKDLSLQKSWRLGDCTQPVAVQWQASTRRMLVACRGDKPVFVALDLAAGVVATVPIGRGVDGMAVDEARNLIVTANGQDSSLSVIRQSGPDGFELVETTSTRPLARVLAVDPRTHRLFTAAAAFTQPVAGPDGKLPPPIYHPDSFTILTYRPN